MPTRAGKRSCPGQRLRLAAMLSLAFAACDRAEGAASAERVDPAYAPEQVLEPNAAPFELRVSGDAFRVTPLARYRISARILHRERYYLGWRAEISPIDLALGWGVMADPSVDRYIDWQQGGRWYFFTWPADSPYRNEDIIPQSANVHIVPGSVNLRRALLSLERNQVIALAGHLVRLTPESAPNKSWQSSLSRTDTGNGACELLYVEQLVTRGVRYR